MRNIKLLLEYEGTAYVGWQRQSPNCRAKSIQQLLEEAIGRVTGVQSAVIGASRTDAGVHARGQVANFRTSSSLPAEKIRDALNAVLPRDMAVLDAADVPENFHARFQAKSKLYEYALWNCRTKPALHRAFCWHFPRPLDLEEMRRAAALLLGTRDFSAFASSDTDRASFVRTVTRADVREKDGFVIVALEADGFLYNMVRAVVGTLVDVGRGRTSVEEFREIMESCDRRKAGRTAPARGLCLVRVDY